MKTLKYVTPQFSDLFIDSWQTLSNHFLELLFLSYPVYKNNSKQFFISFFLKTTRNIENFPLKSCVCTIENYETYMKLLELMFLSSTKSRMKQGIVEEFLLLQWKLLSENFTLRNDLLMVVFHLLVTYIVGQNILVL